MKLLEYCDKHFRDWGKAANFLQDLAEQRLTEQEFEDFLIRANEDVISCDGMDGQLINGFYFDWREFDFKKRDIINAFINYFNEEQQLKMERGL